MTEADCKACIQTRCEGLQQNPGGYKEQKQGHRVKPAKLGTVPVQATTGAHGFRGIVIALLNDYVMSMSAEQSSVNICK